MIYEIIISVGFGFIIAMIVFTVYGQYNARIKVAKIEAKNECLMTKLYDANKEKDYYESNYRNALKKLYSKDKILEDNDIPIECCDKEEVENEGVKINNRILEKK